MGWQGRPESSVTVRYSVTSHACSLAPRFACFPGRARPTPRSFFTLLQTHYKHCYSLNNLRTTKLRTLCLDRVLVRRMCGNNLGFYLKLIMYSHGTYNITKQLSTTKQFQNVMSRCHSLHVSKWLLNLQVNLQTLEFELIKLHSKIVKTTHNTNK